jgi:hypothetical protein
MVEVIDSCLSDAWIADGVSRGENGVGGVDERMKSQIKHAETTISRPSCQEEVMLFKGITPPVLRFIAMKAGPKVILTRFPR